MFHPPHRRSLRPRNAGVMVAGTRDALPFPVGEHREGRVIRSTGSWHDIDVDGVVVASRMRGKFRLSDAQRTNPLAVGDRVTIAMNADGTGTVTHLSPRTNRLSRRAAGRRVGVEHVIAANVDAAWVIQAVKQPAPNPGFVDRFLVMAACDGLPAGIVLNKMDLMEDDDGPAVDAFTAIYAPLGYPIIRTSTVSGEGLDQLKARLEGATSVMTGPSGVGKSTLLNVLAPSLSLATSAVSAKTNKGRHTTTFPALHPIGRDSYVVDTPGIREFGLIDVPPAELSHYFVEFRPYLDACRFPNCTHDHEPGCAVKDAVDEGAIHPSRYRSYLNILDSLQGVDTGR